MLSVVLIFSLLPSPIQSSSNVAIVHPEMSRCSPRSPRCRSPSCRRCGSWRTTVCVGFQCPRFPSTGVETVAHHSLSLFLPKNHMGVAPVALHRNSLAWNCVRLFVLSLSIYSSSGLPQPETFCIVRAR